MLAAALALSPQRQAYVQTESSKKDSLNLQSQNKNERILAYSSRQAGPPMS